MDWQLRVTDNVCEQNMGDLELDLFLNLRRHVLMRVASTPEAIIQVLPCPVEEINIENHASRGVARYQPARPEAAEVSSPSRTCACTWACRGKKSRSIQMYSLVINIRSGSRTRFCQEGYPPANSLDWAGYRWAWCRPEGIFFGEKHSKNDAFSNFLAQKNDP